MKARRRGASEKIESKAARNVCFSKRHHGLFRKADELRLLIPSVSVTAIAFSPAGTPFVSGDTSSLLPPLPPPTDHTKNDIVALLGLDITTLNAAELESHRNDLLSLKNFLLSKRTEIQDEVEDGPSRHGGSGFTQVQRSDGIQSDDDDEFGKMMRDFLNDENCNMDFDDPW